MEKCKLRKLVVFSVMILTVFFGGVLFAYADDKRKELTEEEIQSLYGIERKFDSANDTLIISARKGEFTVTIAVQKASGNTTETREFSAGSPLKYKYSNSEYQDIMFTIVPKDNDKIDIQVGAEIAGPATPVEIDNIHYDGVCATFRSSEDYQSASAEGKKFFEENLSYCFKPQVESNLSQQTVESMISTYKRLWKLKGQSNMGGKDPVSPESVLISPNIGDKKPRKVDKLKCDAFADTNERKYHTTQKTSVTHKGKEVCEIDCVEQLTVTYSPPSSVKAGLCFEYTVTVRSKVSCEAKITIEPPKKESVCTPVPHCNNIAGYQTQGGPTDDFDACIKKYDGGKYTQKGINKCYKKVYKTTAKMAKEMENMLSFNDSPAVAVANKCGVLGADLGSSSNNAEAVRKEINKRQEKADGYFSRSGGVISWNKGSCYWQGLGRYYFSNSSIANRTVSEIRNGSSNALGQYRRYIIDNGGFKRSVTCGETCVWTGCSGARYLNEYEAVKAYEDELQEYETAVAKCSSYDYCVENTATFEMEVDYKTSTEAGTIKFGPSTNTPNKDPDNKNDKDGIIQEQGGECYGKTAGGDDHYRTTINFPGTWINNKNGDVIYTKPPKNDEVFWHLEPNVFCTSPDEKDVNTKWGKWKESGKKVSSDKCSVTNTDKNPYSACNTEEKDITKDINYNIRANISNFGRYKWSINIECFYSVYNRGTDENIPEPEEPITNDKCTGEECDTDISNYNFRVVDLEDMFPSTTVTEGKAQTEPSRETGFNWSPDATNVNNNKYEILPTAVIASIQTVGNKIYDEANKEQYLDYEIYLDKNAIRDIKNNYKGSNYAEFGDSFGAYKSNVVSDNGVSSYRSGLIESLKKSGKAPRTGIIGCNNQANSGTCEKFSSESLDPNGIIKAKRQTAALNKDKK